MSHRQLFASGETIREQKDEIARLHGVNDRLRAEIERLRAMVFRPVTLTDAERKAVVRAWHGLLKLAHHEPSLIDEHLADARALNALLERTRNG